MLPDVPPEPMSGELGEMEERFNRAMISNDVAQISACMTDDWVLVTPEVGIVTRAHLLHAIQTGELSHDAMMKEMVRIRAYGDTAVVTRGVSSDGP